MRLKRVALTQTKVSLILLVTGILAGAFYYRAGPALPIVGMGEMLTAARHLGATGTFGDPFPILKTGPTAVITPLFPAVIALLFHLFGRVPTDVVLACGALVIQGVNAALLPSVSGLLFGDWRPGAWAGLLSVALPLYSWMPSWDAQYTAAALAGFCLVSARLLRPEAPGYARAAVAGALAGVLVLLSPASVFVTGPWILFRLATRQGQVGRRVRLGAVCALAAGLAVVPWALRNYRTLGTFAVKTNFGMTLLSSNNDCAAPAMVATLKNGCYDRYHPAGSMAEAQLLKTLGEAAYDRDATRRARAWIASHPRKFAQLTAARIWEFWFPGYGWFGANISLVTVLSIPGLWLLAKRKLAARWFLAAVFLLYPLLYYVVVADYRYRYPILWLSLAAAGYGIGTLRRKE